MQTERRAGSTLRKMTLNDSTREITRIGSYLLIENPLTGVCMTEDGRIVFCNARLAGILGFSSEEMRGMNLWSVFQCDGRQDDESGSPAGRTEIFSSLREGMSFTKDGSIVYTRQCVYEFQRKGKLVAVWHVTDITEQKSAEAHLEESEKRLCFLSRQVLETQELERKRVASELHDGIGQILTSIKFSLEKTFNDLYGDLPDDVLGKLMNAVSGIQGAVEEVRRISMDLRPSMLDDLGIEAAVSWLCRESQSFHPSIEFFKELDIRESDIDSSLSVVIFRILQEAINNAVKHANATRIRVSLKSGTRKIVLSVRDNGCGFQADSARPAFGGGFGLHSMKERAKLSGGHLRIHSRAGAGTELEVAWRQRGAHGASTNALFTFDEGRAGISTNLDNLDNVAIT